MLMLKKMGSELENHSAIVTQTAEVLELSFCKHIETAWPDFWGAPHPTSPPEGWRVLNLAE